jgi:hypothetical protein
VAVVKGKGTKLERAVGRGDDYVAGELKGILTDMRKILKDPNQEGRARVAAGAKLMEWAKPKRGMTLQVNTPVQVNSQLGLPSAPPTFQEARQLQEATEAPVKPVQKFLPEAPRTVANTKRPFLRSNMEPVGPEVIELPVRKARERAPDKPAPASSVKVFDS